MIEYYSDFKSKCTHCGVIFCSQSINTQMCSKCMNAHMISINQNIYSDAIKINNKKLKQQK